MKNTSYILLAISLLLLGGCAGLSDSVVTTVTDQAGKVTKTVAGASIAKEQVVHKTLQADTRGYYTALGTSGSKMEVTGYQEIDLADGSKGYLPLISATFREAPKRNSTLPTSPSIHPGWHFGEVVVESALTYGLADIIAGVTKKALDSSQTKYYGDYNYNPQTAAPYVVNPVVVQ